MLQSGGNRAPTASGDLAMVPHAVCGARTVHLKKTGAYYILFDIYECEQPRQAPMMHKHTVIYSFIAILFSFWFPFSGFAQELVSSRFDRGFWWRIGLSRKAKKKPFWLKNKKVIVYCFSCREFTEAGSGWVTVPVMK